MIEIDVDKIKYKKLSVDDFIISLDRLTRFKSPNIKYPRVFKDIISRHLISPKIKKNEFENIEPFTINKIIERIWNESALELLNLEKLSFSNSDILKKLDTYYFNIKDERIKTFTQVKLAVYDILKVMKEYTVSSNIRLLQEITKEKKEHDIDDKAIEIRKRKNLHFPIEKIVLAEGITEEILLPKFADKLKYNFDKNGVHIIGAGGKSKVPSLYNELKDLVKIPIIMLLDSDAAEIYEDLKGSIKLKDKIIIIENGEFEDILSKNLIKRAVNNNFYDIEKIEKRDLCVTSSMCKNINLIYKTRGLGEFQKAHFAKVLADNITYRTDISNEIAYIINEIKVT